MLTKVNCKKQPLTCRPQYKLVGHISRHSRVWPHPDHERTHAFCFRPIRMDHSGTLPVTLSKESQSRHRKQLSSATGQLKAMNFIPEREKEGSGWNPQLPQAAPEPLPGCPMGGEGFQTPAVPLSQGADPSSVAGVCAGATDKDRTTGGWRGEGESGRQALDSCTGAP